MFGDKETQGVDGGRRAKTEKEKEKKKETKEDGGKEGRKSISGQTDRRPQHTVYSTPRTQDTSTQLRVPLLSG